jgi:fluoride ion exporter CrcB/FEX
MNPQTIQEQFPPGTLFVRSMASFLILSWTQFPEVEIMNADGFVTSHHYTTIHHCSLQDNTLVLLPPKPSQQ